MWMCGSADFLDLKMTKPNYKPNTDPNFSPNANPNTKQTLIMVALRNRADHYIFMLFLLSFFISSSNLSGQRLDVYHTSTHGVALVRI